MLGFILVLQIFSGYIISCFYTKESLRAFYSVDRINRDINFGRIIRHIHVYGARVFFFLVYLHMGRSLFFFSFVKNLYAWLRGVTLYLLLIITSFVGYVLP